MRSRASAQGLMRGGLSARAGGGAILLRQCRGEWGFAVGICGFWFRVGWVVNLWVFGFGLGGWLNGLRW